MDIWIVKSADLEWMNQVRPPGHHAGVKQAMGFCLHNNAAVAALAAQAAGARKVLILDWVRLITFLLIFLHLIISPISLLANLSDVFLLNFVLWHIMAIVVAGCSSWKWYPGNIWAEQISKHPLGLNFNLTMCVDFLTEFSFPVKRFSGGGMVSAPSLTYLLNATLIITRNSFQWAVDTHFNATKPVLCIQSWDNLIIYQFQWFFFITKPVLCYREDLHQGFFIENFNSWNICSFYNSSVLMNFISRFCIYPYIDTKEESSILVPGLLTRY